MTSLPLRSLLALVLGLSLLSGCGKKGGTQAPAPAKGAPQVNSEAAQFYDAMLAIQKQCGDAHLALMKELDAPSTGRVPGPGDLGRAQDSYAKVLQKARADLKKTTVPNLKGAQELYDATERFVQAEESTLKITEPIMRGLEDMVAGKGTFNPAELGDRLTRIREEYKKIEADLARAQESFAKANRLPAR
jgi:predicted small lipoprotein YifL